MIITVPELRQYISTDEGDQALEARLQALELLIRGYTNNNFQVRGTGQVEYPADVKMGVVNLLKYDLENRDKANVQSESISRHSVTYKTLDAQNTVHGYPQHLMGFLKHYMKARFGQGLSV